MVPSSLALLLVLAAGRGADEPPPAYPRTERTEEVEVVGGHRLANPYSWLEDLDAPRVREWVEAQQALTATHLAAAVDSAAQLVAKMAAYDAAPRVNTPVRRGDRFFFLVDGGSHSGPTLNASTDGHDRVLARPEDFAAVGMTDAQLADFRVDQAGLRVAVVATEAGTSRRVLRIVDVASGRYLPDAVEEARLGDEPWSADGRSLYYSTRQGARPAGVWRWEPDVGRDTRLVSSEDDGPHRYRVDVAPPLDGVVVVERHPSGERLAFRLTGTDGSRTPLLRSTGALRFLGAVDGRAFFHLGAEERLVAVMAGGSEPEEIVDLSSDAITEAHLYGRRFVLAAVVGGAPVIRILDLEGHRIAELEPPKGLLWTNFPAGRPAVFGDPGSPHVYLSSLSPGAPGIYEIDLEHPKLLPWRLREGTAPGTVSIERTSFRSADGVEVPIWLVRATGRRDAGPPPVLVWVYGAYGFPATPYFNGFFRAFIDAGGVLAMPQVRGGGAYGERWHEQGSRAHKPNTVADAIAALEYLVASGTTEAGRIAVIGNSAGSVPAADAAFARPDLVGALILEVPLADLVRHARWSGGWTTEFGDPDIPSELDTLIAVSPYERLRDRRRLPPTLVLAGENDPVAPPHHAYKLVAAIQHAQTGPGPIFLHVVRGAAHQIGVNAAQRLESQSLELAFLERELAREDR